jgi:hypothetical protein
MKIDIENLKVQMTGRELNIYQKADALIEFNKLLDYVNELEQLTIPVVVKSLQFIQVDALEIRTQELNNPAVNITVETSFSKEKIYGVTPQALVDFAHEQISVILKEIYKL